MNILFYLCFYFMITIPAFSCGNNMFYNLLLWLFQLNLIKTLQYTHCIHVTNPWTSLCKEDEVVQNATDEVDAAQIFPENHGSSSLSSSLHTGFQQSGTFTRLSELEKLPSCTFPNLTNRGVALFMREKATPLQQQYIGCHM